SPPSPPSSPPRRLPVGSDEYGPSPRRSAPISPGLLHASASRSTRSLYSALNRLRFGRSTSSGSDNPASRPRTPASSLRSPTARSANRPAATPFTSFSDTARLRSRPQAQ